jgi:mRNA-degrading endonuclease RelE of RelBE toxin-antitoxin system
MEIKFDITRPFEKDLKRLGAREKDRVIVAIDRYAAIFDAALDVSTQHIYRPHKINMPDGLESSLYVLRVSAQIRVILTIEEDPLFDQKIITLFRVVKHDDMERAFNSIAESLYQQLRPRESDNG